MRGQIMVEWAPTVVSWFSVAAQEASRTRAGAVVIASRIHCRTGRSVHLHAGAAQDLGGAVGLVSEPEQVGSPVRR